MVFQNSKGGNIEREREREKEIYMMFGSTREALHTKRVDLTRTTRDDRWSVTAQRDVVLAMGI
jgi:uncharacterized protein YjhX (UPF0386 family)